LEFSSGEFLDESFYGISVNFFELRLGFLARSTSHKVGIKAEIVTPATNTARATATLVGGNTQRVGSIAPTRPLATTAGKNLPWRRHPQSFFSVFLKGVRAFRSGKQRRKRREGTSMDLWQHRTADRETGKRTKAAARCSRSAATGTNSSRACAVSCRFKHVCVTAQCMAVW